MVAFERRDLEALLCGGRLAVPEMLLDTDLCCAGVAVEPNMARCAARICSCAALAAVLVEEHRNPGEGPQAARPEYRLRRRSSGQVAGGARAAEVVVTRACRGDVAAAQGPARFLQHGPPLNPRVAGQALSSAVSHMPSGARPACRPLESRMANMGCPCVVEP